MRLRSIESSLAPALVALAFATGAAVADEASTAMPPELRAEPATAAAEIGKPAPPFTLTDTDGKTVSLASLLGQTVVLEWFNPDCPFVVQSHGETGALRTLPNAWAKRGVTWLAVNSGAEGKQGAGLERNAKARASFGMTYPVLLDPTGATGRAYGAKTTPHVFVIDGTGTLVYRGGVDNAPLGEVEGGGERVAYVDDALSEVVANKPVTTSDTRSYGCSVKYASK